MGSSCFSLLTVYKFLRQSCACVCVCVCVCVCYSLCSDTLSIITHLFDQRTAGNAELTYTIVTLSFTAHTHLASVTPGVSLHCVLLCTDSTARTCSLLMLTAHCPLPTAHCSLFAAPGCSLTADCALRSAHWSLLTAHTAHSSHCTLVLTAHCSLLTACTLSTAHCSH